MIRLLLILSSAVATLSSQDLLWRVEGVGGVIQRGVDLHRIGDYNGDGWEDLLESGGYLLGFGGWGAIRVVSGYDGSILSANHFPYSWAFGNIAPLGDMDQDGVPDYGAHYYDTQNPVSTQMLAVFSGSTHQILWTAQIPNAWGTDFGKVLCGDLDVNGDGLNDVVTTAYSLSPLGTIIVYDNSGAELYRIIDPIPNVIVGADVASMRGDIDGDGCDDFVVTAVEPQNRGALVAISGQTGGIIRVSYGEQSGDKLISAGACGDLDGDGLPDYCGGGSFGFSVVTAFSSATGQIIHSWRDNSVCCMGANVNGGYDLDQDGVPDLAAGSIGTFMNVYSGRDGSFLWKFDRSANFNTCSGFVLAMLAPPPGEQYPLFVYSERCWSSPATNPNPGNNLPPGVVHCYRGNPPGVRRYGLPDATASQPLAKQGMRSITPATTPHVRFTMSDAPAGSFAVLMLGASDAVLAGQALPLMLDPLGFSGITLWQSADVSMLFVTGSSGADAGYAEFETALPPGTAFSYSGTPLFAQWAWVDPGNFGNHGSTAGQRFRLQ